MVTIHLFVVPENKHGIAYLISKQDAIVAGVDLAKEIFNYYDKNLKVDIYKNDGQKIKNKETILKVSGNIRSILAMERLVLNACKEWWDRTKQKINELISDYNVKILDTRKTP